MIAHLLGILFCATVYTVLRYVTFGEVSLEHLPVFLLNKSISFAAVICLFITSVYSMRTDSAAARFWGTATLHLAYIHVVLSLCILTPAYYPKFFDETRMNARGEITMLAGVLAIYGFWYVTRGHDFLLQRPVMKWVSCGLVCVHLIAMGYSGWASVYTWYGYMPPVSLLSFGFTFASFCVLLRTSKC